MRVCLDTNIVIWALRQTKDPAQQDRVESAVRFVDWLSANGHEVAIPSIVVAEVCAGLAESQHKPFVDEMQRAFQILAFDLVAALHFGRLWRAYRDKLKLIGPIPRQELKIDSAILATAVAWDAEVVYTEDPWLSKLGDGGVEMKKMPQIPEQLGMAFDDTDNEV